MERVKDVFTKLMKKSYISADAKEELVKMKRLEELNSIQRKKISELVKIIKTGRMTKEDKTQYKKTFDELVESTKNTEQEIVKEQSTEIISPQVQVDNTEKKLDQLVKKYNGFSEKHPMDCVSYNTAKETYIVRYENETASSKKVENICSKALEFMRHNLGNNFSQIVSSDKMMFEYKNQSFITYRHDDKLFFDIRHVINAISSEKRLQDMKYQTFSQQITNYIVVKNEFGGYIIRELIPEETMYEIILSSNSDFSKSFKKDVSKILVKLRQTGQLVLTNNELQVVNYDRTNAQNEEINEALQAVLQRQISPCTYDDSVYEKYVKKLVSRGCEIPLMKYNKQPTMYFVILTLNDPTGKNRIFCKVGFTDDIATRFRSLSDDYKCAVFLVSLKGVKSEKKEKEFHKLMHSTHSYQVYDMKVNGKKKDEIYIFSRPLYREFCKIKEHIDPDSEDEAFDKECQEIIKDQYNIFVKQVEQIKWGMTLQVINAQTDISSNKKECLIEYIKAQVRLAEIALERSKYEHF